MSLFSFLLLLGVSVVLVPLIFISVQQKRWWAVVYLCMFLSKSIFAFIIENNAKYKFTIDNYTYEQRSWTLSQLGAGTDLSSLEDGPVSSPFKFYERYLAYIFSIVGYEPFFAVLINVLFSCVAIALTAKLAQEIFSSETLGFRTLILLSLYPSLFIWSSVNIRDPMFLLSALGCLYSIIRIVKDRYRLLTYGPMLAICFYILVSLRPYFRNIFIVGVVGGAVLQLFYVEAIQRMSLWLKIAVSVLVLVLCVSLTQALFPKNVSEFLFFIAETRKDFSNIGTDDFALSSFALDYEFTSLWKFIVFIPYSLLFFFFAPFPWAINSAMQALALPEVLAVYVLSWPTLKGIGIAWNTKQKYTIFLLFFLSIVTVGYSVTVSNVGTLFRHRTLVFMILSIFLSVGLHDVWKKNIPTLFKT